MDADLERTYHAATSGLACNLCWSDRDRLDEVFAEYATRMTRLRRAGIHILRVWCPPWLTHGDRPGADRAPTVHLDWRLEYFGRLLALAGAHGMKLLICLFSHVELLDRGWSNEVEDRRHTWNGNPFNRVHGGPCARPADFFVQRESCRLVMNWLGRMAERFNSHPALWGWEIFNEADRVDGFDPMVFLEWLRAAAAALKPGLDNQEPLITVSLADATQNMRLWSVPQIDVIQYHTHGWPAADPLANILSLQKELQRCGKPAFCGEFGWDSQSSYSLAQRLQIPSVIAGSIVAGCALPALPWWWDSVLDDDVLLELLSCLRAFIDPIRASARGPFRSLGLPHMARSAVTPALWHLALKAWRRGLVLNADDLSRGARAVRLLVTQRAGAPMAIVSTDGESLLAFIDMSAREAFALPRYLAAPSGYGVRALEVSTGRQIEYQISDGRKPLGGRPLRGGILLHLQPCPSVVK